MRLRICAAALLCSMSLASAAIAQSDQERAGARAAAMQGVQAFQAGNYKDALSFMERAESLVHAPPHLLYMARAHEKLGNLVQARETYLKIGRERLAPTDPDAFREAQASAAQELRALEPRIPTVTVKIEGAPASGLSITMDGQPLAVALVGVPTPMNPGEHAFEATAPGMLPASQRITVAESAKETVVLTLQASGEASAPPAAAPVGPVQPAAGPDPSADTGSGSGSLKIPAYVALGVGVAGAAVGTVFLLSASSDSSEADDKFDACVGSAADKTCRDPDAQQEIENLDESAASSKTLSFVGFTVGAVGIATGVALLLIDGGGGREQPSAAKTRSLTPVLGYRFVGLSGRF